MTDYGTHADIVFIREGGSFAGKFLELSFHDATGEWSRFWSIGPEDSVPLTAAQVVTLVFDDLGVDVDETEVLLAALVSRYTPDHLIAAVISTSEFR